MSVTSFEFLIFFAVLFIVYYLVPGKLQWVVLCLAGVVYYLLSGQGLLILYPFSAVAVICLCTRQMSRIRAEAEEKKAQAEAGKEGQDLSAEDKKLLRARKKEIDSAAQKACRNVLLCGILLLMAALTALKYVNFIINTVNGIGGWFGRGDLLHGLNWMIPLGISYYSLTLIGYLADVYFGITEPQANPFKLLLYGMFFPCMLSGPILKYREDGAGLYEVHPFDYRQVTKGMQRMLWGFFKVLVVSARMAIVADTIYGDPASYTGVYVWIGTVAFAFQLYTNFSGGMDIAVGAAQCFGIRLPENFERPFLSKSVAEYWRRWHITLGVWMKEYVFYPVLKSSSFSALGKNLRERFGKKLGKQLTTFAGMFILWFVVGVWHGGAWKYVIGSGLLHWLYIVLEELLEAPFGRLLEKLKIRPESKGLACFRILRTFFLVNIGFVFFRAADVPTAGRMLIDGWKLSNIGELARGGLTGLGLDWIEWVVAVVSLLMVLCISLLQEKGSVREQIAARPLPLRWVFWMALLFYVILLGYYGPGFSAAEFIYQGF